MRNHLLLIAVVMMMYMNSHAEDPVKSGAKTNSASPVIYLTNETFKQKIFNYEINKQWKYAGTKPAIIDFYAIGVARAGWFSPIFYQ